MPNAKDRVIIDTNLWISFLLTKDFSKFDRILSEELLTLLFSDELLEEFLEVAKRPKFRKYFSMPDLHELLTQIKDRAEFIIVNSQVISSPVNLKESPPPCREYAAWPSAVEYL